MKGENTIMDLITTGRLALQGAFEQFNVPYGHEGIVANLKQWAKNKKHIIDALRKHPNWCEEALAVVMNVTERRGDNVSEAHEAIDRIANYLIWTKNLNVASEIVRDLRPHLLQKNITQECVDAARGLDTPPPVMSSVGMKTSRYIRKLCEAYGVDVDGDADFRTQFARYADSISPYDMVRPYVFSVNPADYALMSYGNSWTSCQSIAPKQMGGRGEYRAGCFSYMNDGSTVVSYTVEKLPNDMSTLCLMPKYCRQLYYLSDDGKMFIQSRSYPAASKETRRDMRRVAHSIISDVCGFANLWDPPKRDGSRFVMQDDENHYPDYISFADSTTLSYASEVKNDVSNGRYNGDIHIGETPLCMKCGKNEVEETCTLYCDSCGDRDEEDEDEEDEGFSIEYENIDATAIAPTIAEWDELIMRGRG